MDTKTALQIAKERRGSNEAVYREALEHLVSNRAELSSRVFILLPGGFTPNTSEEWKNIREGSHSCGGCGNERVIMPLKVRSDYLPGDSVSVQRGSRVYIRPKGGDKETCVVSIEIEELANGGPALSVSQDPFGPLNLQGLLSVLSPKGHPLTSLNAGLRISLKQGGIKIPVLEFKLIDVAHSIVEVAIDQDMETFDPSKESDRHVTSEHQTTRNKPHEPN